MVKNNDIKEIRGLIISGKIESAISLLLLITENFEIHDDAIHQASRYANYKNRLRRRDISENEIDILYNSIISSLLDILAELKNNKQTAYDRKKGIKAKIFILSTVVVLITVTVLYLILVENGREITYGNKVWNTFNLSVKMKDSHYYHWNRSKYKRYGMLYTWEEAKLACKRLGVNWRLPTRVEWISLAKMNGGLEIGNDSILGNPERTYFSLREDGNSNLNLLEGGWFDSKEVKSKDMDWYGLYWSATSKSDEKAFLFVLDKLDKSFFQDDYDKEDRASCRCIKEN